MKETLNYIMYKQATKTVDMVEIIRIRDLIVAHLEDPQSKNKIDILSNEVDYLNEVIESCITTAVCPMCGKSLYLSDLPQYDYVCAECDENFDRCEVE